MHSCANFLRKKIDDNTKHNKHIVKMLTLQEYIGKVNKILIFCFPFFVLFCIFFVSHMPVPTELKNPPPKMEKTQISEVEQIEVKVSHNFEMKIHLKIVIALYLALQI